jgi:hypothetical protein
MRKKNLRHRPGCIQQPGGRQERRRYGRRSLTPRWLLRLLEAVEHRMKEVAVGEFVGFFENGSAS